MIVECLCPCGRVVQRLERPAHKSEDDYVQRVATRNWGTITCGPGCAGGEFRPGGARGEARLVGEGGVEAGRGAWGKLQQLVHEHKGRGGRFDKPKPLRKPDRPRGRGGAVVNGLHVPPGQVVEVDGWIVDTTVQPARIQRVASDPPVKIPPNDRRPKP
jgi:hypothetical protein